MRFNKFISPFLLVFFTSLVVYLLTSPHFPVSYGDSDELTTTGYFLGLPHPPGYPLLNFFIFISTHLPIKLSIAYKANLVSIIFAALSVGVFYLLAKLILSFVSKDKTKLEIIAVSLALFLAFTPVFWTYSIVTEVFSLNILLSLLIIYLTLKLKQKWQSKLWYCLCCFIGFGLAHQQIIILTIVPSLILLWNELKRNYKQVLLGSGLIIVIPIVLYTTLFLTANQEAPQSWQVNYTFQGIKDYLLRKDYAPNKSNSAYLSDVINNHNFNAFVVYLTDVISQIGFPLFILALIGIYILFSLLPKYAARYLLAIFLLSGPLLGFYLTFPQSPTNPAAIAMVTAITQRMYLMGYPIWILLLILPLLIISKYHKKLIYFMVLFPIIQFAINFRYQNIANYKIVADYSSNILQNLPKEAVLVCFSDISCFSLRYSQSIDQIRQDITIIPVTSKLQNYTAKQSPQLFENIYTRNPQRIGSIISWALYQSKRVYVAEILPDYIEFMGLDGQAFYLIPKDLVFEISKQPTAELDKWQNFTFDQQLLDYPNLFTKAFKLMLFEQYAKNATLYARSTQKNLAISYYQKALKLKPNDPTISQLLKDLPQYPGDKDYQSQDRVINSQQIIDKMGFCENNLQCILHYYQLASFVDPTNIAIRQYLIKLYGDIGAKELVKEENEHITQIPRLKISSDY